MIVWIHLPCTLVFPFIHISSYSTRRRDECVWPPDGSALDLCFTWKLQVFKICVHLKYLNKPQSSKLGTRNESRALHHGSLIHDNIVIGSHRYYKNSSIDKGTLNIYTLYQRPANSSLSECVLSSLFPSVTQPLLFSQRYMSHISTRDLELWHMQKWIY